MSFVNIDRRGRVPVASHHVPIIGAGTAEMASALSRHVGIKLRICFDLDNTLVTYPDVPGDYSTVRPIAPMVDLARQAKEHGHTIIIFTARRMATHGGNAAAALADIGRVTFATIDKFGIPCDEIMFGKPRPHGLPEGWHLVALNGRHLYGKFVKVALNVVKAQPTDSREVPNLLTQELTQLFGGVVPSRARVRFVKQPGAAVWEINRA